MAAKWLTIGTPNTTRTTGAARTVLTAATVCAALGFGAAAATPGGHGAQAAADRRSAATPDAPNAERVARGKYLATIAACHDCHSPKVDAQMTPDAARLLSGRPHTTPPPLQGAGEIRASLDLTAWAGPWGNSFAANLTPDRETGIGARYTEAQFIRTLRTGKKPEGEDLAPPMPWNQYRHMTDEDLKSIYAYLRTLTPVRNAVRSSVPVTTARR